MSKILIEVLPILILLVVIGGVMFRLPKVEISHSDAFIKRRRMNWIILGLTYAFLYFGRYNLAVAKTALDEAGLMSNETFGHIFGIGSIVYGCAFLNYELAADMSNVAALLRVVLCVVCAHIFTPLRLLNVQRT